ncbi:MULTISPECIES: outer membrane lipid asymmetry maintenance protein MlaD [unclassified Gilliamella]|jgi:phospholipid/cholesterol/gamma-HCH transport system substrate-binding protein|uniref:outer membrane lipid asymmetry maintenance protein MlaD n=1 Tax=unclassified Gilliamella TaxID=2685620 RepID=UPI000460B35D|nr:outer membrane lipid asymmetry maintenance protein MlaD [Gilliamella apicola]KDN10478.1 putative ABC transporter, periplasmic component YrbD [Gilliamella apicola]OCG42906.1 outer membrane lipid asymmetry maintenance protein MlaD [Gilliamella apicola]OCG55167.1 outer membrane lipid asymmetry maintenance protein MlaD [Gilliamella apicola]OCG63672.1 outer membrane lipid asymmetry maintenance protein MlaD [Gilliamella apicola]OCG79198.1 outer membrane lipid asymmetry maintenance protein MlaD [G
MSRKVEITVGLFMVLVICSVLFLCFRVTDPTSFASHNSYRVYAVFDNIGGLKARSPIKIGGVVIGRVSNITLKSSDLDVYKPYVTIDIDAQYNQIPVSSSLSIKTSGLLGEQFIDINFGLDKSTELELDSLDSEGTSNNLPTNNHEPAYFHDGFVIYNTKPAMVIEDLIGQFLYSTGGSTDKDKKQDTQDINEN